MGRPDRVAVWIRDRRGELGLSRQGLALKTKPSVSYSTIVKIESGEQPATANALKGLAPALKVDPVWLLRLGGFLPDSTKADEPTVVEPDPRDPKSLVRWLRGDPTLTDDDRRVIADVYERLRRRQE